MLNVSKNQKIIRVYILKEQLKDEVEELMQTNKPIMMKTKSINESYFNKKHLKKTI